jgi:RimJ/RimL family protein N-acetyltransferase
MGVVIRTARLELQGLNVYDARLLMNTGRPNGRRRAAGYPTDGSLVAAGMIVAAAQEGRDLGPFTSFLIVRRADGAVVGDCGFHGPPDQRGAVLIGYGVAESARGRGYATEAVEALISFAHLQYGVRKVIADTTRANQASVRVLQKAGMRHVDTQAELLIFEA